MRSEHRSQPWSPVVGALAGMLVLAAGCGNADQGVVARRSNSSGTSAPVTVAAPPTTLTPLTLPSTVVPVTPVATEPPPTTATEVVIPDGSIDLGHGVFVTPTGDWHLDDNGDEVVTLTDGVTTLDLQVLIRDPGEDPAVLMQEYADTFDADFDAVAYSPATLFWQVDQPRQMLEYRSFYITYQDDDDGMGIHGGIYQYQRDDGLSLVYDVWSSESDQGLPSESQRTLDDSFLAAPAVADPVALTPVDPFRLSSVHTPVVVSSSVDFVAAPGFDVVAQDTGSARVSNGTTDYEVDAFDGVVDVADALTRAQAIVAQSYSGIAYEQEQTYDPDPNGFVQAGIGWNGTYIPDGAACGGVIDVIFDSTTGTAVAMLTGWYWGSADTEPYLGERQFMFRSTRLSFDAF